MSRVAGYAASVGLAGAAAIHALWASGSTWPTTDYDALATLVVGRTPFPSRPLTAGVAGLLVTASALTVVSSRATPPQHRLLRVGQKVVATTLLVRGAGGLAVSALGVGQASDVFRQWDLCLYSPLCLALGAGVAISRRR